MHTYTILLVGLIWSVLVAAVSRWMVLQSERRRQLDDEIFDRINSLDNRVSALTSTQEHHARSSS
jgi:hypothetical protein